MSNVIKLKSNNSKKIFLRFNDEFDNVEDNQYQNQMQVQLELKFEEGFNTGYANAKNDLEKLYRDKLINKIDEFNKIIKSVDEKIAAYDEEFEKLVINLSFEIAQKIARREIQIDSTIEHVLKDSLKKVLGANSVIIKIHPEDFKILNDEEHKDLFFDESFSKIKFEQDERIERGGCVVETEIGNADARIISQFNELKKYFESISRHDINIQPNK